MKIASIGCDRSGFPALLSFLENNPTYKMDVTAVPCLGMVGESMILKIFEEGYDYLLLAGCPLDSCFNQRGSYFAERKAQRINVLLQEAGIRKKVFCAFVTAEKVGEIKRVVESFTIQNQEGQP
ncbi:MAG: hydrogenase iron-sulfur subunit [Candidatus Caldatribacteriaceae bacterium]